MTTINIEDENEVTIQDSNLHLLQSGGGNYATIEQLNEEKNQREQADNNLQAQIDNKVNKTQFATKQVAGLLFYWEDEKGVHIWNTNPQEVNYTEQDGVYEIKTLNYTEENGVYNIGGNE